MEPSHFQNPAHQLNEARLPSSPEFEGQLLSFSGSALRGLDVYNISSPFPDPEGRTYLAGRAERRDSENSWVALLYQDGGRWVHDAAAVRLPYQDPAVAVTQCGRLIVGGVELLETDNGRSWRMPFHIVNSVSELTGSSPFFVGPPGMKDIRFCHLGGDNYLLLTRPQGAAGDGSGPGRIGMLHTTLPALEADLASDAKGALLSNAAVFHNQFLPNEWGGANQLQLLQNGLVGVLGHKANFNQFRCREYCAVIFAVNPKTAELISLDRRSGCFYVLGAGRSAPELLEPDGSRRPAPAAARGVLPADMLAVRSDFPPGPVKQLCGHDPDDLKAVIFAGGLTRNPLNGTACLYAGLSDAAAGCLPCRDPFIDYERLAVERISE